MNQMKKMPDRKKQYRMILCFLLFFNLLCLAYSFYQSMKDSLPDNIRLFAGEQSTFSYQIPASGTLFPVSKEADGQKSAAASLNLNKPFTMRADITGDYVLNSRLFGIFRLKETEVKVVENREVVPCGLPVGIYVKTNGLLVLDTQILSCEDGLNYEPAKNIVKAGDYILKANGKSIKSKEDFRDQVTSLDGNDMSLLISRDGKKMIVSVSPVMTREGVYKLGIWVRDDTQGLGTLTYINGNKFGALGHGISDLDTGARMEIEGGSLYEARILSVQKGEKGDPGELIGQVRYGRAQYLGKIEKNTGFGIYGALHRPLTDYAGQQAVPVGLKQEVKPGKAKTRIVLDGVAKDYDILIEKVDGSNKNVNRGMVIRITDKELLSKTGGIVQGMSGSPILQNGKFIGAVTHVFVDDPTRGYGVFAETMLEEAG